MKILGAEWTVVERDLQGINWGTMSVGRQEICLEATMRPDTKLSTLLHEIIEALNSQLELKLAHRTISQLEAGLFSVLNDNGVNLKPLLRGSK